MDQKKAKEAWQLLRQAEQWLIITHYNPDGDALSSANIFLELAAQLDKKVLAYCADQPGENFSFLSRVGQVSSQLSRQQFDQSPVVIVVDCGSASRTKLAEWLLNHHSNQTIIEFDHHQPQDNYADISFKESQAAATVEVIYDFLIAINWPISTEIARSVLTGLVTDTGNFLHSNTTDKITKIAAKMMLLGARLPKIINQTLVSKNLAVMRLWGRALSQLKINAEYLLAIVVIRQKDLIEFGLTSDDLSGLVGLISSLQGVAGNLLLVETDDGQLKGSLRTNRADLDLSVLANILGGGGHRKAAGFTVTGGIVDTDGGIAVN
ncbi:bifunctional oligoribonuclease/PAP phosphatase NrnA [Candidatus Falkowbacteria bacterium]|nr:bifunctional oligoribonuclease/PAP phosphatase NrnA [Candidatus Falkowbacteria bacterium]